MTGPLREEGDLVGETKVLPGKVTHELRWERQEGWEGYSRQGEQYVQRPCGEEWEWPERGKLCGRRAKARE